MDTEEEIIAIAIVNMYASERGRPARRGHEGSTPLPRDQHAAWVQEHQGFLRSFYRRNDELCKELLRQPAVSFNPFPFD